MFPSALICGQSVCTGCGFDEIWCARLWLFTNVTLSPAAMVTCEGLTAPLASIVIVAPLGPGEPGAVGAPPFPSPPPHARRADAAYAARVRRMVLLPGLGTAKKLGTTNFELRTRKICA
jgi:hypothetical protein